MSLKSIPLIVIAFIMYNAIVLVGGADAVAMLKRDVLPIPLMTTKLWLTWGDLLILLTMGLLFVELMKATYTSSASLLDHGLSMLVLPGALLASRDGAAQLGRCAAHAFAERGVEPAHAAKAPTRTRSP